MSASPFHLPRRTRRTRRAQDFLYAFLLVLRDLRGGSQYCETILALFKIVAAKAHMGLNFDMKIGSRF
jgi:hypothetical protein